MSEWPVYNDIRQRCVRGYDVLSSVVIGLYSLVIDVVRKVLVTEGGAD